MLRAHGLASLASLLVFASPALGKEPDAPSNQARPPWGALVSTSAAAEIVLGRVCLTGIAERRPISDLARFEHLVAMPPKSAGAGASDAVWRLASLNPVYAVAWTDGSCSTYVDGGSPDELRVMADRVIRERPEGFRILSSTLVDGRLERTVYCGGPPDARLVATITTPRANAPRGTRALSSTVYRADRNGLCSGAAAPTPAQVVPSKGGAPQPVRAGGIGGCIYRALPESVSKDALTAILSHTDIRRVLRDPVAAAAPKCTGRPYSDSDGAVVGSIFSVYARMVAAYTLGQRLHLPQSELDAAWSAAPAAEKAPFLASAQSLVSSAQAYSAAKPEAVDPFVQRLGLAQGALDPDVPKLLHMYYSATALSELAEADLAARASAGGPTR